MNGGIYSTGNEIVDENAKLNISGNIIPQVWYRTIIRESGNPSTLFTKYLASKVSPARFSCGIMLSISASTFVFLFLRPIS